MFAMPLAASCSAPSAAHSAAGHHEADIDAEALAPVPSPDGAARNVDASLATPASPDSGVVPRDDPPPAPWPTADTCTFPAVSPPEGATAKQCCHPASTVTVCVETTSGIHHHEIGPYSARTMTITHATIPPASWSFPLDRQTHGSMKSPDLVAARLSFRVHAAGLELRVQAGCQNLCTTGRCSKEATLLARICTSAGQYRWETNRLVRE